MGAEKRNHLGSDFKYDWDEIYASGIPISSDCAHGLAFKHGPTDWLWDDTINTRIWFVVVHMYIIVAGGTPRVVKIDDIAHALHVYALLVNLKRGNSRGVPVSCCVFVG